MPHLCACLDLMHLVSLSRFMLLNATLWLTVTHTFQSNRPNLTDWFKGICITIGKCFCSLLTSNWEVNTGRLLYSCTNFTQSTSFLPQVRILIRLKQNFQLESIPRRYLHDVLKRLLAKVCLDPSLMCVS